RLHVAVDEALGVRRVERFRHLAADLQRLLQLESSFALEQRLQVLALDVAHRKVELAVGLAGRMHGQNMRVAERGGQLRLPEEAFTEALVGSASGGDQL